MARTCTATHRKRLLGVVHVLHACTVTVLANADYKHTGPHECRCGFTWK